MKIRLFFLFVSIHFIVVCQNQSKRFTGVVIDALTNEPISNVLFSHNGSVIGYSDLDGKFDFYYNSKEKVFIRHISYLPIYYELISSRFDTIEIKPNSIILDEIVIGGDKRANALIKNSINEFKNTQRKKPYWSATNLKQVFTINDSLPSYLEGDYTTLMIAKDRDVWNVPLLVPTQTRRTKEKHKENNEYFLSNNVDFIYYFLQSYRFFEFTHPLLKKNKNKFSFRLVDSTNFKNEKHYIINYKAIKDQNSFKGRYFLDLQGQIIIDSVGTLLKITSSHNRKTYLNTDGIYYNLSVSYTKIKGAIYPEEIAYNFDVTNNKKVSKVEGIFSFTNIDTNPVENYRNTISPNRYLFHSSEKYNVYNKSYWNNQSKHKEYFEKKYFGRELNDKDFMEGSNQRINPKKLYHKTKQHEEEILQVLPKTF